MELCSVLCASLDGGGGGGWGRIDSSICMAECLPCSPETITILLISNIPNTKCFDVKKTIKIKFKKRKERGSTHQKKKKNVKISNLV